MHTETFRRIVSAVALPPLRVVLEFDDGLIVLVDFAGVAKRGGLFEQLSDPTFFKRVRIANHGRALAWPKGLDFCADAFYLAEAPKRHVRPTEGNFGALIFAPSEEVAAA